MSVIARERLSISTTDEAMIRYAIELEALDGLQLLADIDQWRGDDALGHPRRNERGHRDHADDPDRESALMVAFTGPRISSSGMTTARLQPRNDSGVSATS